jgi:hypothetical protein
MSARRPLQAVLLPQQCPQLITFIFSETHMKKGTIFVCKLLVELSSECVVEE